MNKRINEIVDYAYQYSPYYVQRDDKGEYKDYVTCEDGSKISPYVFVKAVDCINNGMKGAIKQYYIEQTDINHFNVKLYVDDEEYSKDEIAYAFCEMLFEQRLDNAEYVFEFKDDYMPIDSNGKFKCFRNLVKS